MLHLLHLFFRFFYNAYFNKCEKGKEVIKESHVGGVTKEEMALPVKNQELEINCKIRNISKEEKKNLEIKNILADEIIKQEEAMEQETSKNLRNKDMAMEDNRRIPDKNERYATFISLENKEVSVGETNKARKENYMLSESEKAFSAKKEQ